MLEIEIRNNDFTEEIVKNIQNTDSEARIERGNGFTTITSKKCYAVVTFELKEVVVMGNANGTYKKFSIPFSNMYSALQI